MLRGAVVPHAD